MKKITSTITITNVSKYFESKTRYLPQPPQKWDLERVLKYIERDDYNQLLFDYGEIYCLVVLEMFEQREEYETCAIILNQILTHNEVTESSYKTHLRQIKI